MNFVVLLPIVLLATALGGCATQPNLNPTAEFAPIQPIPRAEEKRVTGSVFDNGIGLLGSKRTYRVGDLKVGDLITRVIKGLSVNVEDNSKVEMDKNKFADNVELEIIEEENE